MAKSISKGSKGGNPPKGTGASKYERGFTAQAPGKNPADRPPKLERGVSNDFFRGAARSAVMPPPTGDTQEPRMSSRQSKQTPPAMTRGSGKGISKGRR